jgi:hypothetical protein
LHHVAGQSLVDQFALEEEVHHAGAEVLTEPGKVQLGDLHEPTGGIEASFQHDGMQGQVLLCRNCAGLNRASSPAEAWAMTAALWSLQRAAAL